MTYGKLVMPTVVGGTLTLAENVDENAPLTTDVTSVKVVFTPDNVKYAAILVWAPSADLVVWS